MDKYIGFDIDSKKTVACVVEKGKKEGSAPYPLANELPRSFERAG